MMAPAMPAPAQVADQLLDMLTFMITGTVACLLLVLLVKIIVRRSRYEDTEPPTPARKPPPIPDPPDVSLRKAGADPDWIRTYVSEPLDEAKAEQQPPTT